jgi:Cft2 family RNA processing exonuclease
MHTITDFITTHADQDHSGAGPSEAEDCATLQVNLQARCTAAAR